MWHACFKPGSANTKQTYTEEEYLELLLWLRPKQPPKPKTASKQAEEAAK